MAPSHTPPLACLPSLTPPLTCLPALIGQVHMMTLSGGGAFESIRCSDGEVVKGQLAAAGQ